MGVTLALVAGGVAAGCGGDSVPAPTDPVLARGKEIHDGRCASCHGIKGQGATGKRLSNGQVTRDLPNVADHIRIVNDGLKGTPMPAWKDVLSPEDIEAVVRYQREVLALLNN